jgi:hypothetical protein
VETNKSSGEAARERPRIIIAFSPAQQSRPCICLSQRSTSRSFVAFAIVPRSSWLNPAHPRVAAGSVNHKGLPRTPEAKQPIDACFKRLYLVLVDSPVVRPPGKGGEHRECSWTPPRRMRAPVPRKQASKQAPPTSHLLGFHMPIGPGDLYPMQVKSGDQITHVGHADCTIRPC